MTYMPWSPQATETLAQQLTDPSIAVRVQAAEAMASDQWRKWSGWNDGKRQLKVIYPLVN